MPVIGVNSDVAKTSQFDPYRTTSNFRLFAPASSLSPVRPRVPVFPGLSARGFTPPRLRLLLRLRLRLCLCCCTALRQAHAQEIWWISEES
jgi:hypothetical protein